MLAPALALAIAQGRSGAAAAVFAVAVASDFADGALARRNGPTRLGGFLDHLADATFVVCGLGALAAGGLVPVALPVLVAAAFVQYTLDSRVIAGGRLRASGLGRRNGIAYYVLVGIPVVRDAIGAPWLPDAVVRGLGWILVATTVVSMADRLLALRRPPPT